MLIIGKNTQGKTLLWESKKNNSQPVTPHQPQSMPSKCSKLAQRWKVTLGIEHRANIEEEISVDPTHNSGPHSRVEA